MPRVLRCVLLWLAFASAARAQNVADLPAYGEPTSFSAVVVFLVLVAASIGVFAFWIWYRSRKQR